MCCFLAEPHQETCHRQGNVYLDQVLKAIGSHVRLFSADSGRKEWLVAEEGRVVAK